MQVKYYLILTFFLLRNSIISEAKKDTVRKKEIPHGFRIREGGHNLTYRRSALSNVL